MYEKCSKGHDYVFVWIQKNISCEDYTITWKKVIHRLPIKCERFIRFS